MVLSIALNSGKIKALNPNPEMLLFLFLPQEQDSSEIEIYGNADSRVCTKAVPQGSIFSRGPDPPDQDHAFVMAVPEEGIEIELIQHAPVNDNQIVRGLVKGQCREFSFQARPKFAVPGNELRGFVVKIRDAFQGYLFQFFQVAPGFSVQTAGEVSVNKRGMHSVVIGRT